MKIGAVAGGGGSIGAVAVMPSTNGSTVADSVAASLRFEGAVLQVPKRCCYWSQHPLHQQSSVANRVLLCSSPDATPPLLRCLGQNLGVATPISCASPPLDCNAIGAGAAQEVQAAKQDRRRSTHLLQVSSCCAHGATARELTDWTRSVTFRISCGSKQAHGEKCTRILSSHHTSACAANSTACMQHHTAGLPYQEGVRNGVRHGDAGERDREHLGACHGVGTRPSAATLVQDIRFIGIQVGHDLRHALAWQ